MDSRKPYDCVFSLGYRCSSAGILKSLGLKQESYPFDWMVSRLPIIEDCISTNFLHFSNPSKYTCATGVTSHYYSVDPDPKSRVIICKETFCFNTHYEFKSLASMPSMYLYFPRPITPIHDVYGYRMMMNHHDIKKNRDHQTYFARCITRWNTLPMSKSLSLYIHPAIFYVDFLPIKNILIDEIRRSHKSISAKIHNDGIYIINVRTPYSDPTNHCCKYVLEEQPDDESVPGCRICILWSNCDLVDAGEIFMGVSHVETYVVKEYVMKIFEHQLDT